MAQKRKRILVIPDTHVPFHDALAWDTMIAAGEVFRPTHVVIMGDFLDFYQLSRFDKDRERMTKVENDCEIGRSLLDEVEALGAREHYFIGGNHEVRFERYIAQKAPQLSGMLGVEQMLMLEDWKVVDYKDGIYIDDVFFTHDLGKAGTTAVRHARVCAEGKVVIGHLHRLELQALGRKDGSAAWAACPGWLGDPEAVDYKHRARARAEYTHGFATIVTQDGFGHINLHPISDGVCRLGNRIIGGR